MNEVYKDPSEALAGHSFADLGRCMRRADKNVRLFMGDEKADDDDWLGRFVCICVKAHTTPELIQQPQDCEAPSGTSAMDA